MKFWQLRTGCGSAHLPRCINPLQASAMLARRQQQHQLAASRPSVRHNLHFCVAQVHYTKPRFKLQQQSSLCFVIFSQQYNFTPDSSRPPVAAHFWTQIKFVEQELVTLRCYFDSLSVSRNTKVTKQNQDQ